MLRVIRSLNVDEKLEAEFPSLHTIHVLNRYLDSAACLSMRALRSSFSCWIFLRLSSNLTFLSFCEGKGIHSTPLSDSCIFSHAALLLLAALNFCDNFHLSQVLPACRSPSASFPADGVACFWYPAPLSGSPTPAPNTVYENPSVGTEKKWRDCQGMGTSDWVQNAFCESCGHKLWTTQQRAPCIAYTSLSSQGKWAQFKINVVNVWKQAVLVLLLGVTCL